MGSPRSVRFDDDLLKRLNRYAAEHPGASVSSLTNRLVDEGLRCEEHPGVTFRSGPSGRRAALADGPDLWEVVATLHTVRASDPSLDEDDLVAEVGRAVGVSPRKVRIAVGYYADFPDEVDARVAAHNEVAARAEERWLAERRLLGSAGNARAS